MYCRAGRCVRESAQPHRQLVRVMERQLPVLTDWQRRALQDAARVMPEHRRDEFLARVTRALSGEVSDAALSIVINRVFDAMRVGSLRRKQTNAPDYS